MAIIVTSSAFREGEMIPRHFACDGENVSPPLAWSGVPAEAVSLALVCEDPDTAHGSFYHWIVYNIPTSTTSLPEGVPTDGQAGGGDQGINNARKTGYTGPCPPSGERHRYFFRLYALDNELPLSGEVTHAKLQAAMDGHVLAEGHLMGVYSQM